MPTKSDRSRPKRKASTESSSSHKQRDRSYVDDTFEPIDISRKSNSSDDPPSYDEVARERDAKDSKREMQGTPTTHESSPPSLSMPSRIIWPILLSVPLFASGALLYLVSCSGETLRPDLSTVKIELPQAEFDSLYQSWSSSADTLPNGDNETAPSLNIIRSPRENSTGGYLTLGTWGWCLRTADAQR